MNILLPIKGIELKNEVNDSFARAPYFLVYNSITKEKKYVKNTAHMSPGGAGVKAAQKVIDLNTDILLVPRLGENAAIVICGAKIKVYKTKSNNVDETIDMFLNNQLKELKQTHQGLHHK